MKKHLLLFFAVSSSLFAGAQQQLPNPSFENWATNASLPYEEPTTWMGASVYCDGTTATLVCSPTTLKTTDAYTGSYAAKLVNFIDPTDASTFTGKLMYTNLSDGYVNFTNKPKTLTGYYKFNNAGSDVITITVSLVGATISDIVAYGTLNLTASKTAYTPFTIPLYYMSQSIVPKDVYVTIAFNDDASVNSDFIVDNLAFTYISTPTIAATPTSANIKFFPNPGKDMIYFEQTVQNISIQSVNGSSILTHPGDSNALNISSLDKGIYLITYVYNDMLIHDKLIVE
jgi:hypothetical protein